MKTFLLSSGFPARLWLTFEGQKQKFWVCSRSNFFFKFWIFVESIQSSFLFSFQKYKFFWNRTKIDVVIKYFLMKLFFLEEEFLWNVKELRELFRVHLDLSLSMWVEFRPHCGSQEDPYCGRQCGQNVKRMWAKIKTLNDSDDWFFTSWQSSMWF